MPAQHGDRAPRGRQGRCVTRGGRADRGAGDSEACSVRADGATCCVSGGKSTTEPTRSTSMGGAEARKSSLNLSPSTSPPDAAAPTATRAPKTLGVLDVDCAGRASTMGAPLSFALSTLELRPARRAAQSGPRPRRPARHSPATARRRRSIAAQADFRSALLRVAGAPGGLHRTHPGYLVAAVVQRNSNKCIWHQTGRSDSVRPGLADTDHLFAGPDW